MEFTGELICDAINDMSFSRTGLIGYELKTNESTTYTIVFETYINDGIKHVEARSQVTFENTLPDPVDIYAVIDDNKTCIGTIGKR